MKFVAVIAVGIIAALIARSASADDDSDSVLSKEKAKTNGNGNGNGNGDADLKKAKVIPLDKPSGNPPNLADTFDHDNVFSVRFAFTFLGYPNEHLSGESPKGEAFVGQFQRDYNAVSAACLNDAIFIAKAPEQPRTPCVIAGIGNPGKLTVDRDPGNRTLNGVEVAKRLQAKTGKTWKTLVSMARQAGF